MKSIDSMEDEVQFFIWGNTNVPQLDRIDRLMRRLIFFLRQSHYYYTLLDSQRKQSPRSSPKGATLFAEGRLEPESLPPFPLVCSVLDLSYIMAVGCLLHACYSPKNVCPAA